MAKISPVSIKYTVYAKFIAQGTVEKPDVIGALFGQTEGLLGSDLEMRELQKEGKIGRIDVVLETRDGKTEGRIEIPSALDKAETSIIAAAIETIERVGPTDAKIEIEKIEDVRGNKREYILDRAKKLLEQINTSVPESKEIAENVKVQSRLSKLQEYGEEKLPAGDLSGNEIIVVEGRADVINLIRNGVNNVICMNGTQLPKTIKEISYEKSIILFVDGDRGGILIAKNAVDNARIDFIATAPDGKEVEELSGKEILAALRKKIPVKEFFSPKFRRGYSDYRRDERRDSEYHQRDFERRDEGREIRRERYSEPIQKAKAIELTNEDKNKLQEMMTELENTKMACLLDENLETVKRISSNGLALALLKTRKNITTIVMDGKVTMPIIQSAERKGVSNIIAKNFQFTDTTINLLSM